MTEDAEIVALEETPEGPLMPVASVHELVAAIARFEAVKAALLVPERDTYVVDDKERIKKSGWRKLALAFNVSDEIVSESQEDDPEDDEFLVWHVRVRAWSRGGRTVQAVGTASSRERKFAHPDHDIHALAHTRAKSRAIADMLGSSNEVAEESPEPGETPPPAPATNTRHFLKFALGEDLAERIRVSEQLGKSVVTLPKPYTAGDRETFVRGMLQIGETVKDTPSGLTVVMATPESK